MTELEVEHVFLVGLAQCRVLGRGFQQRRLGAVRLDRFSGNTRRRRDFRERGAGVPQRGEQLRGRRNHLRSRLRRLLLAQLRSVYPRY